MYVCVYVCMCVCVCMYVHMCVCMAKLIYISLSLHKYYPGTIYVKNRGGFNFVVFVDDKDPRNIFHESYYTYVHTYIHAYIYMCVYVRVYIIKVIRHLQSTILHL